MPAIKTVQLSTEQHAALEHGWRHGTTFGFRQRCQMILLKAQKRTSKEVAQQVGCCEVVVNNWRKRYEAEGIEGLKIKKGRGRRAILQPHTDLEAVRRAVQTHRQRVSHANAHV